MLTDDSLLQEFLTESREHLESIEPELLVLEAKGANAGDDVINKIFRAIHSIKGAAGFFGFESLTHFSHLMESVFMKIRDKVLEPEPAIVDVLFKGVDRLMEMVNDINASGDVDVAAEQANLEAILAGTFTASGMASNSANANVGAVTFEDAKGMSPVIKGADSGEIFFSGFNFQTTAVRQALATGQFLYAITVFPATDWDVLDPTPFLQALTSTGTVLDCSMPLSDVVAGGEFPDSIEFLYGSVLEPDLITVAVPVAEGQITHIPSEGLLPQAETVSWNDEGLQPLVQDAQNNGKFVYGLTLTPATDYPTAGGSQAFFEKLGLVGNILWSLEPVETFQGDGPYPKTGYFLFGSVLEPDLAPVGIPLPIERIYNYLSADETIIQPAAETPIFSVVEASESTPEAEWSEPIPSNTPAREPKTSSSISTSTSNDTIRVKVDLLNRLMNLAGEMVLFRNQLNQKLEKHLAGIDGLSSVVQNINATTSELQEYIMQTRMQPIGNVFNKFNRVVRDIARTLEKSITIEITGDEVELDKSIVESLSDPLTHLIRNSCDHGIESPVERKKLGKPECGTIQLKAFQEGGQIIISIQDDGKGIHADNLAKKAVEKGVITPADLERMSTKDKVNLIFHPGFSMAAKISDISGRGVGMDVVRTNIEKLGGTITVETEVGMGTIIYLHLPLTLAIIPSLLVGVQNHNFAIPQINVVELLCVRGEDVPKQIESVGSAAVLKLRGRLLPLVRLTDALGMPRHYTDPETSETREEKRLSLHERRMRMSHPEVLATEEGRVKLPRTGDDRREVVYPDYNIAVLKMGGKQYGLIVDDVHNLEEIVVKPTSQYLSNCGCFAGATIMGDGSVAMILDVAGVATTAKLDFSRVDKEQENREQQTQQQKSSNTVRMEVILFSNGSNNDDDQFAVPLQHVLRLEKFNTHTIQHVGGKEFLTYQGRTLPLVRLENHLPIPADSSQPDEAYLILPRAADGHAAIIASRIVDVDTLDVTLEPASITHAGVQGTAVINDRITTFLKLEGFLKDLPQLTDLLQKTPITTGRS